jgi:hypothetical protein
MPAHRYKIGQVVTARGEHVRNDPPVLTKWCGSCHPQGWPTNIE